MTRGYTYVLFGLAVCISIVGCDTFGIGGGVKRPPVCPDDVAAAAATTCECGISYCDREHQCFKENQYNTKPDGSGCSQTTTPKRDPDPKCASDGRLVTVVDFRVLSDDGNAIPSPNVSLTAKWKYFNPTTNKLLKPGPEHPFNDVLPTLAATTTFDAPSSFTAFVPYSELAPCEAEDKEEAIPALGRGSFTIGLTNFPIATVGTLTTPALALQ